MRLTGAMLLLALAAAPTMAQSARPKSWTMTCAEARMLVARQGAVVMNFSPTTYERIVNDMRFCLRGQEWKAEFAPTRDNPRCHVGYVCREIDYERD